MTQTYVELERAARELDAEERSRLADVLLESLHRERNTEIEAAWVAEVERRLGAYERGEAQLVPAAEVFEKARLIAGS